MKRVRLPFLPPSIEVEFSDRERALAKVEEIAKRGTRAPLVVFGPEGCGKSAWLRQSAEILKDAEYDVIYVDLVHRSYLSYTDVESIVNRLSEAAADITGVTSLRLVTIAIDLIKELVRLGKKRVAVLIDEAFQSIGLEKAAVYVKSLLSLIEYPPRSYENIVAVATTSEGLTRSEIGRHRWADIAPLWNMPREGFTELYEQINWEKKGYPPPYGFTAEDAWLITGGNPYMLARLAEAQWSQRKVAERMTSLGKLLYFVNSLSIDEKKWLLDATEDPDTLFTRERIPLLNKLVERNLVVDDIPPRSPDLWIDTPPPEKDPDLGIGKHVAWQTPLHREAVKLALKAST
jgi:energy-coupling factor transporter ATP-binding protein EcfA2